MMERLGITIEISPGQTVDVPGLDKAIRATAGRIMAEKIQALSANLYSTAANAQINTQRSMEFLRMASELCSVPFDELFEQTYQWSQTVPMTFYDCASTVYHKVLWQQPFPWEKKEHE